MFVVVVVQSRRTSESVEMMSSTGETNVETRRKRTSGDEIGKHKEAVVEVHQVHCYPAERSPKERDLTRACGTGGGASCARCFHQRDRDEPAWALPWESQCTSTCHCRKPCRFPDKKSTPTLRIEKGLISLTKLASQTFDQSSQPLWPVEGAEAKQTPA